MYDIEAMVELQRPSNLILAGACPRAWIHIPPHFYIPAAPGLFR